MGTLTIKRICNTLLLLAGVGLASVLLFIIQGYIPIDIAPTSTSEFQHIGFDSQPLLFLLIIAILNTTCIAFLLVRRRMLVQP